jgi:hypothetical protein
MQCLIAHHVAKCRVVLHLCVRFRRKRDHMNSKHALLAGLLCLVNSFAFASIFGEGALAQLVGAQCNDDCTQTPPHTQGECLHLGQSDPCSTITCIQNVCALPHCTPAGSGGSPCDTGIALGGCVQTLFDQDCSGNSPWAPQTLQAGGPCQPEIIRNRRCLAPCGSGTGYGPNPRYSYVCN